MDFYFSVYKLHRKEIPIYNQMKGKVVTFGELLMRLSPPKYQKLSVATSFDIHYGGAEANAAISLAQLGNSVSFVSVLPDNDIGRAAIREVRGWGVDVENCQIKGDRMGSYYMEHGVSIRGANIIYDRAHSSLSHLDEITFDCEFILNDADWALWTGITPSLSLGAAKACKRAIEVANKKDIKVSCDLNYRSKLWKYGLEPKEVMPDLIAGCSVILANEEDTSVYLGITPSEIDYEEIEGFGKRSIAFTSTQLFAKFPNLDLVISTLRETISASSNRWSAICYNGYEYTRGITFEINNIVDRVGGGDSFFGAFLHGYQKFTILKEALDFSVAASALKLTIDGDYNITSEGKVFQLLEGNKTGRISR